MGKVIAVESRFWPKVNKRGVDDCWPWLGRLNRGGYGTFRWTAKGDVKAHRAAWELCVGPIPPGMFVLHRCDIRHCVNPAHLFLGSLADNNHDRDAKGRTVIPVGEHSGKAKIDNATALKIRVALELGADPCDVATAFAVGNSIVYNIGQERRSSTRALATLPPTLKAVPVAVLEQVGKTLAHIIREANESTSCPGCGVENGDHEVGCYAVLLQATLMNLEEATK